MEEFKENYSEQEVVDMICQYFNEFEEKEVSVSVNHGRVISNRRFIANQSVITYVVDEKLKGENGEVINHRFSLESDDLERIFKALLSEKGINVSSISYTNAGITVIGQKNNLTEKHI